MVINQNNEHIETLLGVFLANKHKVSRDSGGPCLIWLPPLEFDLEPGQSLEFRCFTRAGSQFVVSLIFVGEPLSALGYTSAACYVLGGAKTPNFAT